MLKLTPILLIVLYGMAMWFFSVWRLKGDLNNRSTKLDHASLNPLLGQLANAMGLPRVIAYVYEIPAINGLAAPDGRVFITRGFLDRLDAGQVTATEIASVIAHELGHVSHGHARRRLIDFAGQNTLRAVLHSTFGRLIPIVGGMLVNLALATLSARLSQRDEYEADRFATALMVKANLDAPAQISLLTKLDAFGGGRRSAQPAWLLSHPAPEKRVAAIRENLARWQVS